MPLTFASPESFLQLPWTLTRDTFSVGLQFRTWNKVGLLMTFDLQHQAEKLWVYLSEARARLQVHKAGRIMVDITAGISNYTIITVHTLTVRSVSTRLVLHFTLQCCLLLISEQCGIKRSDNILSNESVFGQRYVMCNSGV